jgi:cytochrome c peroxidase
MRQLDRRWLGALVVWVGVLGFACGDDSTPMTDAGMEPTDSGRRDAGPPGDPDAGMETPDAGMETPDAGMAPDAGRAAPVFDSSEMAIIATLSPLPDLPPDTTNAVADDEAAALLGQRLFFDARLSGPLAVDSDLGLMGDTGRVSCASCHLSEVMSDHRSDPPNVSLGVDFHTRNAPGIVNSAFYTWTNWGGRFSAQWELPPVVLENGVIMRGTRLALAHHLFDNYRAEYDAIFEPDLDPGLSDTVRFPASGRPNPMMPGVWEAMAVEDQAIVDRIFTNYGKVIQAYMRRLVSRDAPFDRFVAGDATAIGVEAQWGLKLFIGAARCVNCHSGPFFTDQAFHNLGVPQVGEHVPPSDDGRFRDTPGLLSSRYNSAGVYSDDPMEGARRLAGLTSPPPESTRGAFRTPTLRGVTFSAPYMHSGQLATLEDVLDFYEIGGMPPVSGTRDMLLHPIVLSDQDREDLLSFLEALEGEPIPEELRTAP